MASSRRLRPRSLAARLLESSFHASFGGFLLWLVWVVVRAPAAHLATALVGKIAFALTVGTVGSGWLLLALMTLTGIDEAPPLPDALAELCPGCGNLHASPGACSRCGLASLHSRRWHAPRPGASAMLSATASMGLLGLGLFMVVEPSLHGRSLVMCLLLAVMGATPLAVGSLGLLRFTRDLRRSRRQPRRYQAQARLAPRIAVPYMHAIAHVDGEGQLVHAEGWSAHRDRTFHWTRRPPLAAGVDYRHEPREVGWQCDESSPRAKSEGAPRRDDPGAMAS